MATWGDFIKEVPIVNKRSEGIFVKADHVLDLWEERNKLRKELALLQAGGGGSSGTSEEEVLQAVAAEREACAREIEEMAEALGAEAEPNPQLITLLEAVARLLRNRGGEEAPMAEPMDEAETDAPMAEPMEAEAPLAEPMESGASGPETPTSELAAPPLAEPMEDESGQPKGPTLADLLEQEGIPRQ